MTKKKVSLFLFSLLLTSCSSLKPGADFAPIARSGGFHYQRHDLFVGPIVVAWRPAANIPPENVTEAAVFIEGDGLSYTSPGESAVDPTPDIVMGFDLASASSKNMLTFYLGRPCQFVTSPRCRAEVWTTQRFSPETIQAYDDLLTKLKTQHKVQRFRLYGYSGGAAIALGLIGQRDDIAGFTSFAGLLDIEAWTRLMGYDRLRTYDEQQAITRARRVPQMHYIGALDEQVPPRVAEIYQWRIGTAVPIHRIPNFTHSSPYQTLLSKRRDKSSPYELPKLWTHVKEREVK